MEANGTKYCSKCFRNYNETWKICLECGDKLEEGSGSSFSDLPKKDRISFLRKKLGEIDQFFNHYESKSFMARSFWYSFKYLARFSEIGREMDFILRLEPKLGSGISSVKENIFRYWTRSWIYQNPRLLEWKLEQIKSNLGRLERE